MGKSSTFSPGGDHPDDVISALRSVQPLSEHDPVIVQGLRTWAASINPAAAHFIDEIAAEVARRGLAGRERHRAAMGGTRGHDASM
jgi:hypothetical protein